MHSDRQAEKAQKLQQQWARQDQHELDEFLIAMFGTRQGRRYAMWLLEISNALGTDNIYTANALATAFNCGQHNVGKQIWAHMLDIAPDLFFKALKEQADERNTRANTLTAASTPADESASTSGEPSATDR